MKLCYCSGDIEQRVTTPNILIFIAFISAAAVLLYFIICLLIAQAISCIILYLCILDLIRSFCIYCLCFQKKHNCIGVRDGSVRLR